MTEGLNKMQSEAVLTTNGPLLILAGAGSGKTRVITNRIAYLIQERNVSPKEILAITFTNKAAAEMKERIEAMLGLSAGGAWICTFHSMCVRILRMHAHLLGYDNNFTIYDSDDSMTVCKNICKMFQIDTKRFKEKQFLSQISAAKDKLKSVEQFEYDASGDFYLEKVAKVYREYQRQLKGANAMDFDDLISKTVELFRKNPDVLSAYQERFRYISVDEYQDTNMAQFELVKLLAGKYGNICVVGDDDQSIYKFRGADIENILSFEKSFPGAKVIRLEQNYRSTKNILDAANAVIKNNVHRKSKALWTDKGEGAKIMLFHVDNPYMEAERVVNQVQKFVREGFAYNDCACLYRTNAQSRNLEEAFIRENIPYKIVGGVNFYQRKEIKDILAYLKTIDNDRDDVAVKRIINVPKRSIGKTTTDAVAHFANERGISFYSALETGITEGTFGKTGDKLKKFTALIDELKEDEKTVTVKELIDAVLEKTGYLAELKAEKTDEAQARIENIEELINKAAVYQAGHEDASLGGFLEEVSLIADIDSWDSGDNYVSLITVHSAKGLEFPNVFLCGMEDGLFPMSRAICSDDESDLEEERRLAYVAITRAKKNLVITASRMRMVRGETMVSVLSRFVKEIPDELIEPDKNNIYVKKSKEGFDSGYGRTSGAGSESFKRKPFGLGDKPSYGRSSSASYASGKSSGYGYGESSFNAKTNPYAAGFDEGHAKKQFEVKSGALDYAVGDRVSHVKFGEGTVLAIDEGGRDYEVTVDFEDFGTKKMFAAFAKLKKL